MTLYYVATTPYNSSFVIVDEHQLPSDIPEGYIVSGWPPFSPLTDDIEDVMHTAQAHIAECEYLKLWHIYMN